MTFDELYELTISKRRFKGKVAASERLSAVSSTGKPQRRRSCLESTQRVTKRGSCCCCCCLLLGRENEKLLRFEFSGTKFSQFSVEQVPFST